MHSINKALFSILTATTSLYGSNFPFEYSDSEEPQKERQIEVIKEEPAKELPTAKEESVPAHDYKAESKEYWQKANLRASKLFGGWNIKAKIKGGLESRENEIGSNKGPYGAIEFEVPLYDTDKRESLSNKKQRFLDSVAKLCKQLTTNGKNIRLLKEKARLVRATFQHGGLDSIDAYFEIQKEIVEAQEDITEARRSLDVATKL